MYYSMRVSCGSSRRCDRCFAFKQAINFLVRSETTNFQTVEESTTTTNARWRQFLVPLSTLYTHPPWPFYPAAYMKQGVLDCVYTMSPTPAPATPSLDSTRGDGDKGGAAPGVAPESPTTDGAMAPTLFQNDGDDDDSGLSTGEAVGIGVGASVVAIAAGVTISNWYKGS